MCSAPVKKRAIDEKYEIVESRQFTTRTGNKVQVTVDIYSNSNKISELWENIDELMGFSHGEIQSLTKSVFGGMSLVTANFEREEVGRNNLVNSPLIWSKKYGWWVRMELSYSN